MNGFEEFKQKTKPCDNGCVKWTGFVENNGYGRPTIQGVRDGAHRWAWRFKHGEIPEGMYVLHKCDNRLCVNPEHLFLGTLDDNNKDRNVKGRAAYGERHGKAVLSREQAKDIWNNRNTVPQYLLALKHNTTQSTVRKIVIGENWRSVHD